MRFFWQTCHQQNNCTRSYVFFVIYIITFLFTFICSINTFRFYKRFKFELLPLSVNTLVTLALVLLCLFQQNYQYNIIIYLLEIYTYFLFAYTFMNLYMRSIKKLNKQQQTTLKIIMNIIFAIFSIIFVIIIIICFIFIKRLNCGKKSVITGCFVTETLIYLFTMFYCYKIKNQITSKQPTDSVGDDHLIDHVFDLKDQYIQTKITQINLLVISFSLSILLGVLQLIVKYLPASHNPIACLKEVNIFILVPKNNFGTFLLIINDLSELIPHIFIPIILYMVPIFHLSTERLKYIQQNNIIISLPNDEKINNSNDGRVAGSEFITQYQAEKKMRETYQKFRKSNS